MARSKRYQEAAAKIDENKLYTLQEAIALLPQTATTKFEPSVELHIRLGIDIAKSDQQVRGTVALPHGSGKTARVAVFAPEDQQKDAADADLVGGEELIESIAKSGKIDFDVAIATPDMMKHMAKVARILGPKGLMPSPKNETVTKNIAATVAALKKGKIAYKNDSTANVHVVVGKTGFTPEQLQENIDAFLDALKKSKPASSKGTYFRNVSLNVTMGPGIRVTTA
jgi:large subunit ribosomal protein L1